MYACLMIFFLSNALESQLISTGAFEISFNGEDLITDIIYFLKFKIIDDQNSIS